MRYRRLYSLFASSLLLAALGWVGYRWYDRTYHLNPALERALAQTRGDATTLPGISRPIGLQIKSLLERGADVNVRNPNLLEISGNVLLGDGTALEHFA